MDPYIWINTSGKFVCSYTGSDLYGNGTPTNPFKTLTAAYWYGSAGGTIVCRGIFNDNPTKVSWLSSTPYYGNNATIVGDYYGAAIWDGQNTEFLYGYIMRNIIVLNSASSGGFVGLGVALNAIHVGHAAGVNGLAGSPALLDNSVAYWGVLGGTSAVSNVVFSNMLQNGTHPLSLGGNSAYMQNNTFHNATKENVRRCFTTSSRTRYAFSLFTKFAIYLDQAITFEYCMFNAECTFWYSRGEVNGVAVAAGGAGYAINQILTLQGTEGGVNGTVTVNTVDANGAILTLKAVTTKGTLNTLGVKTVTGGTGIGAEVTVTTLSNATDAQFIPTGADNVAKMQSIINKNTLLGTYGITFIECKYTSQLSSDIYNNHAKLDYTLKHSSDAVFTQTIVSAPDKYYYGALKPAINVAIHDNSDGKAGCWDNRTVNGDIVVANNSINIDNASPYSDVSTILSKIITINPNEIVLDELKALHIPIFNQKYYLGDKKMVLDTRIYAGTTLAIGRYIVRSAKIRYGIDDISVGNIVNVTTAGTTFSDLDGNTAYVLEIQDPNIWNPVHVRMAPFIYGIATADTSGVGAPLKAGVTYLNFGNENVTINQGLPSQRTLVPKESFIAETGNTWHASENYELGIIFDDDAVVENRIVPSGEWMSALSYRNFFNYLNGTNQVYDTENDEIHGGKRLMSSGNPKAYKSPYVNVYGSQLMNRAYLQFKIILRRWDM